MRIRNDDMPHDALLCGMNLYCMGSHIRVHSFMAWRVLNPYSPSRKWDPRPKSCQRATSLPARGPVACKVYCTLHAHRHILTTKEHTRLAARAQMAAPRPPAPPRSPDSAPNLSCNYYPLVRCRFSDFLSYKTRASATRARVELTRRLAFLLHRSNGCLTYRHNWR